MKNINIKSLTVDFIREKLIRPFGFKGRSLTELWQTVCTVESDNFKAACPGTQSVLWSDGGVFAANSPAGSDALMFAVTQYAANLVSGQSFTSPDALLDGIIPELNAYADKICGRRVRRTFVLNALVGLDYALWSVFALENGLKTFDEIIPCYAKKALSYKHSRIAQIPLISYNVDEKELRETLEAGASLLKIKIGASVDRTTHERDMASMLEKDAERLAEIHNIAKNYQTSNTKNGKIAYYLDANGRYDTKDRLCNLLDRAEKIGCIGEICLIEEPFEEENHIFVGDLPVIINADESAHSLEDVRQRITLGYKAVALKPIAKTMSVSFKMAAAAHESGAECLCADLTVNPLLAEWNKQFAARIAPLSAMNTGCVEVNGDRNYITWDKQKLLLPEDFGYNEPQNGCFMCGGDFYESSGKLFGRNGYFE